jgi:hypothetical protein
MASSPTDICNLALSHLGISSELGNMETERSAEAAACRRFFETARDATLRDFPWPFASKSAVLGLVEEEPNDEWGYSYRYPSDCVAIRRMLGGLRNPTRATRVPYVIGQDATGLLIYTDTENAEMEYTARTSNTYLFPSDFVMAFSFRLSAYMAPRVTGGDPYKLAERSLRMYEYEIEKARARALGEGQVDIEPDSEFISARN